MRRETCYDLAFAIALSSTAVALGGALAHLFELPNKMGLAREDYFIVQGIDRGWNLLAIVLVVQLISFMAVIVLARHEPNIRALVVVALVCLIAEQVLFWTFAYPANVATENWTRIPANWESLRSNWEYSHAAGALFQLAGMGADPRRHRPCPTCEVKNFQ